MNKIQLRRIRDAIMDGMEPEEVLEVFNLDTERLLDCISNDDIEDVLDVLEDFIPRAFDLDSEMEE